MQLRALMRFALVLVLASMIPSQVATAQQEPLNSTARAELAAITLTSAELPQGYQLASESFIGANQAPFAGIDPGTLESAGFRGMYVSSYEVPGEAGGITSYASLWVDAGSAQAGFELIEDESVTEPGDTMQDEPLEAGDGPAELTTGVVETGGATLHVTDGTFTVDRFVVGVSVETLPDNAPDDDAMASLIESLESRAERVAGGEAPDGIDLAMPGATLDLRPLGAELQAGFISSSEAEALYGVSGSSLGGIKTSWVSLVATGEGATAPYVVVAVSSFENDDNAARVVAQSADIVPLSIELQPVDGYSVEGTDSIRAYNYESFLGDRDGSPDSFRAVAQSGNQVIVIDVQGAGSIESAQASVSSLMASQVQCSAEGCELPETDLGG